ncbi:hypothetical protein [Novosphingobium sp. RL4]|uniref:hypothetical protein n=1 Tax=Novosphingobium sp. RL4 TaxID=3109595 RepID=UPI002D7855C0|nr:hypothetical protein [Novosphingobium sp. RL4]WRT91330.1 hypothetical protein U9J33_08800 [Novosphingobium sp. RL4]
MAIGCSVDWAATGSMISGFGAWVGAGAVFYAACKAANTFDEFRKQKAHERRMAAAESVLTLAYKVRRAFVAVRAMGALGHELNAAIEEIQNTEWYGGLNEFEKTLAQQRQITLGRAVRYQNDWDQIFEQMPIARALFGEDAESALQTLWRQLLQIRISADIYAQRRENGGLDYDQATHDIWDHGEADELNRVGREVAGAVQALEGIMLPILHGN